MQAETQVMGTRVPNETGSAIEHEFLPDTWGRDQCDRRVDEGDDQARMCGRPRREHRSTASDPRSEEPR
jgi:hypothetical protein